MNYGSNISKEEIDAILKRELNLERESKQETVGYGGEQRTTWLYKSITNYPKGFGVFLRFEFEENDRLKIRVGLIIDNELDEKGHFRDDCNFVNATVVLANIETFKAVARI